MKKALMLFAAGLATAVAASQPPVPRPSEETKPKQQIGSAKQGQRDPLQKPSSDAGSARVFANTADVDQDAKQHRGGEGNDSSPADWWMVALTFCTLLTAAAQAYMFWRQLKFMRATLDTSDTSLTVASAAAKAAELSARAAVAVEMPRLEAVPGVLSQVSSLAQEGARPPIFQPHGTAPTPLCGVGSVRLVNHGRTAAVLKTISLGWQAGTALEHASTPVYGYTKVLPPGCAAAPHGVIDVEVMLTFELDSDTVWLLERTASYLWVFGKVTYVDFMGDQKEFRFCWRHTRRVHDIGTSVFGFAADGDPPEQYRRAPSTN